MKVRVFGVMTWLAACSMPVVLLASPQEPPPSTQKQAAAQREAEQIRFQTSVMEGVLQSAAENGARQTAQELKNVVPDGVLWSGAPRARGFRLENYGYFFDVEVPVLRGSIAWSIEVLDRNQAAFQEQLNQSLQALRGQIQLVTDPRMRDQMTQTLKRIEGQVGSDTVSVDGARTTNVSATAVSRAPRPPDPIELYTARVKEALIDAILDHSAPLQIHSDEWLTIAARGAQSIGVGVADPDDPTVFLRIRGSDLVALHTGKLTRQEARNRVELKEF